MIFPKKNILVIIYGGIPAINMYVYYDQIIRNTFYCYFKFHYYYYFFLNRQHYIIVININVYIYDNEIFKYSYRNIQMSNYFHGVDLIK